MNPLNIVVTGATGMVGYHVVAHLLKQPYSVTATARNPVRPPLSNLKADFAKLDLEQLDITDREGCFNIAQKADIIVHCAGIIDPYASRSEIQKVNVTGTINMLDAAIKAGCKQFIHISSLSVITAQRDQYGVAEDAEMLYCGEPYADSKVDAENAIRMKMGSSGTAITILRPGFIYGPMERAWMPRLLESLRTGKAMLIDGGIKQTNVIGINNLCLAIELALMNPQAQDQVFNLTDGQIVTKKELFDTICEYMGYPPVERAVPGSVAKLFCNFISSFAPYLPVAARQKLARYSKAAFRLAGLNQGFDISKAEKHLGYRHLQPFTEGMQEALNYFQARQQAARPRDSQAISR